MNILPSLAIFIISSFTADGVVNDEIMKMAPSFYPSSIPPAPINKMGQIPRFSNTGYGNLICSLSETERAKPEFDLGQVNDVQARDMADKINRGDLPVPRHEMRQATVHAIKGYLLGQIDLCQLASFHLLDGGISDKELTSLGTFTPQLHSYTRFSEGMSFMYLSYRGFCINGFQFARKIYTIEFVRGV